MILEEYSFNVPKNQTHYKGKKYTGGLGGYCIHPCKNCIAYKKQCAGCDTINCVDKNCRGNQCDKCVVICGRAKDRIKESMLFLNDLEIDKKKTDDKQLLYNQYYIPAINRRLKEKITLPVIEIPFYAIYDFEEEKLITTDLKDYFNIDCEDVIINFYMKDDKILYLYDLIMQNKFIDLIRMYKNITHWHTPCFSIFEKSNNFDILHNWKKQWLIGDIMRDAGMSTIQEVLGTQTMRHVKCGWEETTEIIIKKGIKKVSQCGQLDYSPPSLLGIKSLQALPEDCSYISVGMNQKVFDAYHQYKKNMYVSNYDLSYRQKKRGKEYLCEKEE